MTSEVTPNLPADMAIEPTVSAGFPRAFLDFAVSRGADRETLIARSGLRVQDLADQDNRVPLDRYLALIEAAVDLTGEPALALLFGEAVKAEDVTIIALITMASETMADAFAQMARFARLMIDAGHKVETPLGKVSFEADGLWLVNTDPTFVQHPYLEQIVVAQTFCGGRRMLGAAPPGMVIHLLQDEPPYRPQFDRIFGACVVFGSGRNAVRVSQELLSLKLPTSNRYAFGVLSERAEALMRTLEAATTTRGEVERVLTQVLRTGEVGLDRIAKRMGVSEKSLYRRLKAEGVTFTQVLDDLRRRLALSFLADKKVSVSETAFLMGFSEPAAFSRAFKRWTGASPKAVREPVSSAPPKRRT